MFEAADRDPSLVDRGALNFVVVGGGATGVETAGALADMIHWTMTVEYRDLAVKEARVHLVDIGHQLLGPFSERAHDYAFKVLTRKGVELHLDTKVTEVTPQGVILGDGSQIATRCVVWGGGIAAPGLAAAAGVPQGHGGRIEVQPDLTVEGFPRVYAIGDVANIPGPDGQPFPQLGSVALQSGQWAAKNLLAEFGGETRQPFKYKDKGIMAMIGRGSAIAAMGPRRREVHGPLAFAAWLGVHAALMTGVRARLHALADWAGANVVTHARCPSDGPRGCRGDRLERGALGRADHCSDLRVDDGPEHPARRGARQARSQMAFTLGFHIILASLGVAFPALMLIANYRGLRKNDPVALRLAERWSKWPP